MNDQERAVMRQALERLRYYHYHYGFQEDTEAMAALAVALEKDALAREQAEPVPCSTDPAAPHGFDRTASHTAGRYVCECEHWQAEPVQEPVAWRTFDGEGGYDYRTYEDNESYAAEWAQRNPRHIGWVEPLYTAPPGFVPLTDEEILKAVGWETAEMYMKLTPNFPVEEARKETVKNARAIERALKEKNRGR